MDMDLFFMLIGENHVFELHVETKIVILTHFLMPLM